MDFRTLRLPLFLAAAVLLLAACTGQDTQTETVEPVSTNEVFRESKFPPADIVNDEGGPVFVTGEVAYTNPFFTAGVAEPLVILEDQAGFVDRDRNFIFPVESQVLGQITSDFFTSPFGYSLTLPNIPNGQTRDVDQDGDSDEGVQTYAVAYWTNAWGDPYLEKRDQHGGGWSSAYASTLINDDRDQYLEVYGGNYLVYAPDDLQGFPSGYGNDGMLFSDDDPIVGLPAGWTLVNLDTDPFTFDRSSQPVVDLLEPESIALSDFSGLSYTEAFDEMLAKLRTEYAFTDNKDLDWDALSDEFRPLFEQAEADNDVNAYVFALRDFLWSIPDGHIGMDFSLLIDAFQADVATGLGMAIRDLDDGRVVVNFILEGGPADEAGIEFGAEILELDGLPVDEAIDNAVAWSAPFSTEHTERLQKLRYGMRFPQGSQIKVVYQNPGGSPTTVTLDTVPEFDSFNFSSFFAGVSGTELPVEFEILDEGYGYVAITDFLDNELLTVQLWERMITTINEQQIPGLIIDMRRNGGGSGFLADQLAAYFFTEDTDTGNTGFYDDSIDDFFTDPGDVDTMFPPRPELQYDGPVALLVGPACASACEFFSYDMTLDDRATVIGEFPTAGLGGSVEDFLMPEDLSIRFTIGRAVDMDGNIHIEGIGVVPSITVPLTAENLDPIFLEGQDVILQRAIDYLDDPSGTSSAPAGEGPRLASSAQTQVALGNGTPTLEDLANESYDDFSQAGETYSYTVDLSTSEEALWLTAWCATTPELFEQNWENIELVFGLNGEEVPLGEFEEVEGNFGGLECRFYASLVQDWAPGEHTLSTEVTFLSELDDGDSIYPAGTHVYEYVVTASE